MKSTTYFICLFAFLFTCKGEIFGQHNNLASYVNPFIGTGGHGHTFPGATRPFGMVQLSPDTRIDGSWDGCSGYHYSDTIIYGFSHTHLSGTGCSDYGDIALQPFTDFKKEDDQNKGNLNYKDYASGFSHNNEKASAGYYSVVLNNGIKTELTTTTRVGFHKYTFPKNKDARIIIQIDHRDKTLESTIHIISNKRIEGWRRSEAWAKDQYIYFALECSEPFFQTSKEKKQVESLLNNPGYYCLDFGKENGKPILIKVGISNVSMEGAWKNLSAELPHWDFEKVKSDATLSWQNALKSIEVTGTDHDQLTTFYTAMYHTMIQPNVAMDVDGKYRGRDNLIHVAEGFTYYSVFSLWDTFRGTHPLYTLTDQKRTSDFINTFIAQYEQGGRLPVWELSGNETDCMIGYHAVSVIADAIIKGIKGFDYDKAYRACKHSAMLDHLGLAAYKKNGCITMDDEHESVSKTLEYAYDDWCISQVAKLLKKEQDYQYFMARSQSWKNLFDTHTRFMRPKKNGGWLTPFDPREVNNNFTEGNSWQYSFFVPHDIPGLIKQMGGAIRFEQKLDELFSTDDKTTGREQADITGLIGQYAHGNEPSHHMAYLYNYTNDNWKGQQKIQFILHNFYKNNPEGLIGNEDCGQMSAWYILSAMGLYQVTPGSDEFLLGSPLFTKVKINLENGKSFHIQTSNLSEKNIYAVSSSLNKKLHPYSSISYREIMKGGTLQFHMSPLPSGKLFFPKNKNVSSTYPITIVPIIHSTSKVFDDNLKIELQSIEKNTQIYYSFENLADSNILPISKISHSKLYSKPFYILKNEAITAYCASENVAGKKNYSKYSTARFYKKPNHWKINILSLYNPQYTAGGPEGLIDGINGDINWRKGEWQGYQGQNFECIIDLNEEQVVTNISSNYLQDTRSWILMPVKVEYFTSLDGKNFTPCTTVNNSIEATDYDIRIKNFSTTINATPARFVKVKAYNYGLLPKWHLGAGGQSFIFIDEININ